ncbi:hypothetical protein [Uruburuella suis]|uniref:hypothetical protein n=1 Tax=Uruburuella suis TaxID=252130 RepID=UPI003F4AD8F1
MKHLTLIYTENHPNFGELCNTPLVRGLIHKAAYNVIEREERLEAALESIHLAKSMDEVRQILDKCAAEDQAALRQVEKELKGKKEEAT